ncbi:hypothetical protein [Gordonia terrae]|uniref:SnoaL-like domain-containing protein n=2 Tax=Gordonia terrae TaxID=2055 RepID=A0AAD0NW83_9ACTN|nr:hypothetical protein [Gordonia terrae]VTR09590.1 Uncharacterised protein [Clostridioides difficile]ANY22201.1 hypothetical protein BCM27_04720 [Gordonia terrae]AWO82942.1 hypothetical protein DLJ61_04760 [Gordonia terrae]VTS29599.1 Uncharacterised protein [Gordonia terrae]GAB46332.1 hypothetical protein GOTRE_150_00740 [Gordonia terrae NBRC 100016]
MVSRSPEGVFGATDVIQLVSSWWFHYDEWDPTALRSLVVDDFAFKCRSDTGTTSYEDFIRIDATGVDEVMAWQEKHRLASPYPLRHNSSNIVVSNGDDNTLDFKSYILVNKIIDGRPHALSSGIVNGAARVGVDSLLLSSMEIVLDTRESAIYSEVFDAAT